METMKSRQHPSISRRFISGRLLLPFFLLPAATLSAQLHEQINVEGKYVPEVIKAEKLNTFPKAVELSLPSSPLSYDSKGVAASFTPMLMPLPATGWNASRIIDDKRGYLELGAGSWLNSTLSAGYRIIDNNTTLFGVRLQHNSTSLWKPEMSDASDGVKQWRYDESLGLYASHVFKGAGRLDAAIDYHLGAFDYYGWFNPAPRPGETVSAPSQTLNDLSVLVNWRSRLRPEPSFSYALSAGVRHFAFRALPLGAASDRPAAKGTRETDIKLGANLRMPWDNGSSIGLDAKLDILLYGGPTSVFYISDDLRLSRPNKYAVGTLTPYYRFTRGLLDIKLGADIDVAIRAGESGHRYSLFHFAPDVRFAVQTGKVGIYLNALGGTTLNTLAALREHDYYMMPALVSTRPSYTPLDAAFGINLGPFAGFSMDVHGAFRSSRNIPLGGWYTAWTDYGMNPLPAMQESVAAGEHLLYSFDKEGLDIHGFSLGARVKYEPSSIFSLNGAIDWQPQDGKKGFFNGYDRPRLTARAEGSVSPISPLRLTVAYDYRGVREIYTRTTETIPSVSINGGGKSRLVGLRLPDLCVLNFAAAWQFNPNFSIWMQADNLLNRHDSFLPLLPTQGLSIIGGVKILF